METIVLLKLKLAAVTLATNVILLISCSFAPEFSDESEVKFLRNLKKPLANQMSESDKQEFREQNNQLFQAKTYMNCDSVDTREIPDNNRLSFGTITHDPDFNSQIYSDHKDQTEVPEGFYLCGQFDLNAPTMIFVPGWSRAGEAKGIILPELVHNANLNIIIFRNHIDTFDLSVPPHNAERRIYKHSVKKFVSSWTKLGQFLEANSSTPYQQEIRIIGHSLGAQVASASLYQLTKHNPASLPLPARLDILDIYLGRTISGAFFSEQFNEFESFTSIRSAWVEMLKTMKEAGIAITSFQSLTAFMNPDLCGLINVQNLSASWITAADYPWNSISRKHTGIVGYYVDSFRTGFGYERHPDSDQPLEIGISARTPTSALKKNMKQDIFFVMQERNSQNADYIGQHTVTIFDDFYKKESCR